MDVTLHLVWAGRCYLPGYSRGVANYFFLDVVFKRSPPFSSFRHTPGLQDNHIPNEKESLVYAEEVPWTVISLGLTPNPDHPGTFSENNEELAWIGLYNVSFLMSPLAVPSRVHGLGLVRSIDTSSVSIGMRGDAGGRQPAAPKPPW